MTNDLILKNIARYISLTKNESDYFLSLLINQTVKHKQIILQKGTVCTNGIFVNSGVLRSYTNDEKGVEHVINFAPADWWIADSYSYFSGQTAIQTIEVVEDADLFFLSRTNQELLYKEVPKFERFFRILIEKSLVSNQQRIIDGLSLSAKEQYLKFCKRYPTLINTLPRKYIASYIGVTPEFFSKMMAGLLKEGK